ncbi:MAG: gamma-glutamyltransferase family protein, partial [Aurantibacter sp.]
MTRVKKITFILLPLLLFINCKKQPAAPTGLVTEKAMVVSAREEASRIGSDILKKGGNVFDAMVATELALAVAYPVAGNIGGGGFMIYRKSNGEKGALDYREKAPAATHKDIYLDSLGNVIAGKSTLGATAVGVPGTVAGVYEVHQKLGSLSFEEILEPVIQLAERGVVVTQKQAERLAGYQEAMLEVNGDSLAFPVVCKEGDTIKYAALANTLKRIATHGRDGFYKGETAKILADFIQRKGGYITEEDLANYETKWREPIEFNYKDIKITSMSPPSSGGVTINQIFKMMEPYKVASFGHNSPKTMQLFVEASRRAYADRNYYLGDPDFVDIPIDRLLSDSYLEERMANFSFDQATKSEDVS